MEAILKKFEKYYDIADTLVNLILKIGGLSAVSLLPAVAYDKSQEVVYLWYMWGLFFVLIAFSLIGCGKTAIEIADKLIPDKLRSKQWAKNVKIVSSLVGLFLGTISCAAAYTATGIDKSEDFGNSSKAQENVKEETSS